MGVFGTWSARSRSSRPSVKQARSSAASSRQGNRFSGWQWWSTASSSAQRASSTARLSVLEPVRLILEEVVLCCETLDVQLLDRDVRGREAVPQRLQQHLVALQVLDRLGEAGRVPDRADGGARLRVEQVR